MAPPAGMVLVRRCGSGFRCSKTVFEISLVDPFTLVAWIFACTTSGFFRRIKK